MNIELVNNYIGNWQAGHIQIQTPAEEATVKILVGGDLCATGRVDAAIIKGDGGDVFHGFKDVTRNQALTIVNLECPLTMYDTRIPKTGFSLRAHPNCAEQLKRAGIDIVTLANNHILDMGESGLYDTMLNCERAGIKTVGAGKNIDEAAKPLVVNLDGLNLAIINFTENEWSIAGSDRAGASPLDLINNYYRIHEAKQKVDFVLVILHGGNEYYPLPSPRMKKTCRYLVDVGADAVVCHHTHVPSGLEIYRDAPIVYGTGNLVFDWDSRQPDEWYKGYMVELSITLGQVNSLCLLPYVQCDPDPAVKPMTRDDACVLFNNIEELASVISDAKRLEEKWNVFCDSKQSQYQNMLLCPNRIEEDILHYINIWPFWRAGKDRIMRLCNLIRCEAHRDVIIKALLNKIERI